jgi:hypothetical protein
MWLAILEEGRVRGELAMRDPEIVGRALLGMVADISRWYASDGRYGIDAIAETFTDLALHGVLALPEREAAG